MNEIINLNIKEAKDLIIKKEISVTELVQAHISAIDKFNDKLNSYIELTYDLALQQAKESEIRYKNAEAGLIEGMPIAVKDMFCTKGVKTTACSKILENFTPEYESTVTTNIFKNGGIMIGKTNMDEFGMGSSNTNSCFGSVLNPWKLKENEQYVPGGSSGGSASAIAANLCMGALGTDTGGSIRQPASYCGIVGIKPTYGRCSRYGMIAFASSLDQAGVFAKTVDDAALLLEAICGYDPKDSTSKNIPKPKLSDLQNADVKGLKIGIPKEYNADGLNKEMLSAWEDGVKWLKEAGAEIVEISLPHTEYALAAYYIIAPAEASSNLARYDGVRYGARIEKKESNFNDMVTQTRTKCLGTEVKRRIMIGTYVLSASQYGAYYTKAQKIRRLISEDFKNAFSKVDAILAPTARSSAFAMNDEPKDPVKKYLNDIFTVPASLAGLPCMSVPVKLNSNKLPLGLQVIGNLYNEETVLKIGSVLEQAAKFTRLTI